jgi:hypothetical protein
MLQRLAVHSEHSGGARHIAIRFIKTPRDVTALELAPVFTEVCGEWHV